MRARTRLTRVTTSRGFGAIAVAAATVFLATGCATSDTGQSTDAHAAAAVGVSGTASATRINPAKLPPDPSPPKPYVAPAPQTITSKAEHGVLRMLIGETRHIVLAFSNYPGDNWDPFVIHPYDGPTLITIRQTGGYPGNAPITADITATRAGRTVLSALSDAHCFYNKQSMCMFPQKSWRLRVIVAKP